MTRIWTDDRIAELENFERLLREVESINSGSHCLERIGRCIELAHRLTGVARPVLDPRPTFREFLRDLAIADRTASLAETPPVAEPAVAETPAAPFDLDALEAMLASCVPGGSYCDPQAVADAIRAYFSEARQ
jgi:hypothetical protein